MKQISCTKSRWKKAIDQLLKMGQGNLTGRLSIKNRNDDFEELEILINLINEEWLAGVLNNSLSKPKYFHKYIRHFQIILNRKLNITNFSQTLESQYNISKDIIIGTAIEEYIDTASYELIKKLSQSERGITYDQRTIQFLNEEFQYSLVPMTNEKYSILNLYQFQTNLSHFLPYDKTDKIKQYQMQKRYRQNDIIDKIKNYLDHADFSKSVTIDFLCKEFGINKNHLSTAFMENYQCGAYEYFIKRKMEQAYLLVANSKLTLNEISIQGGFSSYPTFSNAFFKHFNIRPRALRKTLNQ